MLNRRMYRRLYRSLIESKEARRKRLSLYDARRRAMVLTGRTFLTKGEEEACRLIAKEAQEEYGLLE